MSKREDKPSHEILGSLEAHLAKTLKPNAPPRDFVRHLRDRVRLPEREVIVSRLRDWNKLLLVFGSVMSGMLVVITVARALYYMVGRKNIG
jgi:hypothetical protein